MNASNVKIQSFWKAVESFYPLGVPFQIFEHFKIAVSTIIKSYLFSTLNKVMLLKKKEL